MKTEDIKAAKLRADEAVKIDERISALRRAKDSVLKGCRIAISVANNNSWPIDSDGLVEYKPSPATLVVMRTCFQIMIDGEIAVLSERLEEL